MPLLDALFDRAGAAPDAPFLLEGEQRLDYGATAEAVARAAAALARLGVRPGDRVLLAEPNGIGFCVALYGILHTGGCAVLVNPRWTAHELGKAVALTRPRLLVGQMEGAVLPAALVGAADPPAARCPSPDGLAVLLMTSGTTGQPKAVMLTQDAIAANARQLGERKRITERDRFLCSIPLFHSNGLVASLQSMLVAGASLAILDRFTLEGLLEAVGRYRVTALTAVPTLYRQLLDHHRRSPFDLSSLRLCASGSAPMPPALFEEVERSFGARILEGYGLSECSAGATGNPLEQRKIGSIGTALPRTEVEVREPESGAALADGETGELWIRGPQLMRGYFENREATVAALTDEGWLRSGDLGYRDTDGFFFIRGRRKELILRSGFNVYPAEVENELREIDGIDEVAVVGLHDTTQGELVHAALITKLDAGEAARRVAEHARNRLAGYKRPSSISLHAEFPRTGTKVQKSRLAEELAAERQRVIPLPRRTS